MLKNKIALAMLSVMLSFSATAAMTISGTRIIYPGGEKEVSVRTNNRGDHPPLVQVWVDDGKTTGDVNNMKVPFIVTPPIYRVEPGKGQTVRVIYNGMALPQDRESLYWFNMLEIPPAQSETSDNKNRLELAFRTRIKIIYRPSSLGYSGVEKLHDVTWQVIDNPKFGRGVKISNPTAYFMNFDGGEFTAGGRVWNIDLDMLAPLQSKEFYAMPSMPAGSTISSANIRIINDFGAAMIRKLKSGEGNTLTLTADTSK